MIRALFRCCLSLVHGSLLAFQESAQLYRITELESNGALTSIAVAINDSGWVVCSTGGFGASRAFLWKHGVAIDLGTLGGSDAAAKAINNRGEVVGTSQILGDGSYHAFHWNGVMLDLFSLGGTHAEALGINDSGWVVDYAAISGDSLERPVLWRKCVLSDLGSLRGVAAGAMGINNESQAVGWSDLPATDFDLAVLWENGSVTDLGLTAGSS
jgi:probable HAF family extracellular repeat protein